MYQLHPQGMVQAYVDHFVTPLNVRTTSTTDESGVKNHTKKHNSPNKHHHHGGGAAKPSGGMDMMNLHILFSRPT